MNRDSPGGVPLCMPLDPEELLGDWEDRARRQAELSAELSQRMLAATAEARSPDGEVHVVVDHAGGLAELRLEEWAMGLRAAELAGLIVETTRKAQSTLATRMAEVVKEMYGSDSSTTAFIAEAYAAQFPEEREGRDRW